jgi:amino-acid N-acetyltransferase
MSWSFHRPTAADLPAVRNLLATAGLPFEDVHDHLDYYLVVWDGKRLVGVVGLEMHGGRGLLRSLAVDPASRGTGLGKALTKEIFSRADSNGVNTIGLLTTTAEKFFEKQGFTLIPREEIPEWIKESKEFKIYCPSTAVCMLKKLDS